MHCVWNTAYSNDECGENGNMYYVDMIEIFTFVNKQKVFAKDVVSNWFWLISPINYNFLYIMADLCLLLTCLFSNYSQMSLNKSAILCN